MKNYEIITCPICGAQYLPGEIYSPDYFVGKPKLLEKDSYGKIIFSDAEMDLDESYICDYCSTPINIKAHVHFDVKENITYNFNNNYKTIIKKTPIFLTEK